MTSPKSWDPLSWAPKASAIDRWVSLQAAISADEIEHPAAEAPEPCLILVMESLAAEISMAGSDHSSALRSPGELRSPDISGIVSAMPSESNSGSSSASVWDLAAGLSSTASETSGKCLAGPSSTMSVTSDSSSLVLGLEKLAEAVVNAMAKRAMAPGPTPFAIDRWDSDQRQAESARPASLPVGLNHAEISSPSTRARPADGIIEEETVALLQAIQLRRKEDLEYWERQDSDQKKGKDDLRDACRGRQRSRPASGYRDRECADEVDSEDSDFADG